MQALETEKVGIEIYALASRCAINEELRIEWQQYLEQTLRHREILLAVFAELGIDPEATCVGRSVCAHLGRSLLKAMHIALSEAEPDVAQRMASECVAMAESRHQFSWELIARVAESDPGPMGRTLAVAYGTLVAQEDRLPCHSADWARELWIHALGLPAVLPPPEDPAHTPSSSGGSHEELPELSLN